MSTYINRLSLVNFKAMTRDVILKPVTIFYGDNETGKTGLGSDAVRIGLLGFSPRHGNKPNLTFGFAGAKAGAGRMMVGVGLSDGTGVDHNWELRGQSVSYSKTGNLPAVPKELLDTREYLKKSGPEKIRYVFGLVDLPALGFTTEKVTANLKGIKVDPITEESERVLNQLVEEINLLGEQRDEGGQTYQQWMENVAAHVKTQKQNAEAVLEDMAGTIQGLTQLRTQDAKEAPESVRNKLADLRLEYQEAVLARQKLENGKNDYDAAVKARDKAKAAFSGGDDRSAEIAAKEKAQGALSKKMLSFRSQTSALLEKQNPLNVKNAELEAAAKSASEQADELETETEAQLKLTCCPTCKSKGAGWKKSLKTATAKKLKELQTTRVDALADSVKLKAQIKDLTEKIKAARAEDIAHREDRDENQELSNSLKDLREHQAHYIEQKNKVAATEVLPAAVADAEIIKAKARAEELQKQVLALEDTDRQANAAIQDAKRAEQAQQQHAAKTIEVEVLKQAQKVILELQKEMAALAFGTFMDKVNLFCSGILRDGVKLEYREGEVGYWRDASWVGLDYFSGIEELTSFAGLSVALCQQSPIKLVIMDELGRMRPQRKQALVRRMLDLQESGLIDQFIGIDVDATAYAALTSDRLATIEVK
jgi:hypothetical protein